MKAIPILLFAFATFAGCGTVIQPKEQQEAYLTTIADLRVTAATDSSLTVTWTAPADLDDSTGAAAYELRYLNQLFNVVSWNAATVATTPASPGPPGTVETWTIEGLSPLTTYYIALRGADAEGRWSGVSNVASGITRATGPAVLWAASNNWFRESSLPMDLAFAPDGRLLFSYNDQSLAVRRGYVSPRTLFAYNPETNTDQAWQLPGSKKGLVVAPDGGVFVSDRYITKLTADLEPVLSFGIKDARAPGQLGWASDIVVDAAGFLYAASVWHHRIQKFTPGGEYVMEWDAPSPFTMALDGRGRIYVRRWSTPGWVDIYSTEGDILGGGPVPGTVSGLGTDRDGNLYLAGGDDKVVTQFSPELEFIQSWPVEAAATDVAVDTDGYLYVLQYSNPSVVKLSREGEIVGSWSAGTGNAGHSVFWAGISVASDGEVFVAAPSSRMISRFTPDGVLLAQWGRRGSEPGEFGSPVAVAPTANGTVFVADIYNNRIQKFDKDGRFILQFGNTPHDDWVSDPADLALDSAGNLYVADRDYNRIGKYDSDGIFLTTWGGKGSGPGEFLVPRGIAVDGQGCVYVWDSLNHRVQVFTSDGGFLRMWPVAVNGSKIVLPSEGPAGFDVDPVGRVYIVDPSGDRIVAFSIIGTYLGEWGGSGAEPGRLRGPRGMTVGPEGQICVVDLGNHRLQTYAKPDLPLR